MFFLGIHPLLNRKLAPLTEILVRVSGYYAQHQRIHPSSVENQPKCEVSLPTKEKCAQHRKMLQLTPQIIPNDSRSLPTHNLTLHKETQPEKSHEPNNVRFDPQI
jgi:hypothetical protein